MSQNGLSACMVLLICLKSKLHIWVKLTFWQRNLNLGHKTISVHHGCNTCSRYALRQQETWSPHLHTTCVSYTHLALHISILDQIGCLHPHLFCIHILAFFYPAVITNQTINSASLDRTKENLLKPRFLSHDRLECLECPQTALFL